MKVFVMKILLSTKQQRWNEQWNNRMNWLEEKKHNDVFSIVHVVKEQWLKFLDWNSKLEANFYDVMRSRLKLKGQLKRKMWFIETISLSIEINDKRTLNKVYWKLKPWERCCQKFWGRRNHICSGSRLCF